MQTPDPNWIARYITQTFDGTVAVEAWGETSFFYNPGRVLPRGTYFATLKSKDGDNDRASKLYRPGVFRLNIGLPPRAFEDRFGPRPTRPPKGGTVKPQPGNETWDFAALDRITPHPVYGWMGWISVLNPSASTWEDCKPDLASAQEKAAETFATRLRRKARD